MLRQLRSRHLASPNALTLFMTAHNFKAHIVHSAYGRAGYSAGNLARTRPLHVPAVPHAVGSMSRFRDSAVRQSPTPAAWRAPRHGHGRRH